MATGWAIAWRINLWARLRDGDHAHKILQAACSGPSAPIRTCSMRIRRSRSTAISAARLRIAEMLLQSVAGEIVLLPALPRAWPSGAVSGLRARGGFELDISWSNGALTLVRIVGAPGGEAVLRYGESLRRVRVGRGRSRIVRGSAFQS